MTRYLESLIAGLGVFTGSLLWDQLFGDGIQGDDYFEAFSVALVAAIIEYALSDLRRRRRLP